MYILWSYLYKNLKNANQSIVTDGSRVKWSQRRRMEGLQKGRRNLLGMIKMFIVLIVVMVYRCNMLKVIKLYILNMYSLLYVSNSSIKLFFNEKKTHQKKHSESQITVTIDWIKNWYDTRGKIHIFLLLRACLIDTSLLEIYSVLWAPFLPHCCM